MSTSLIQNALINHYKRGGSAVDAIDNAALMEDKKKQFGLKTEQMGLQNEVIQDTVDHLDEDRTQKNNLYGATMANKQAAFNKSIADMMAKSSENDRTEALRVSRAVMGVGSQEDFDRLKAANPIDLGQYKDLDLEDAQFMARSILSTEKPDGQLTEVYDPDSPTGTRYVSRTEAAGQPGKPSKGMSITTPDGTVINTGVSNVSGQAVAKPTRSSLEKEVISTRDTLDQMETIMAQYKPEHLNVWNRLDQTWNAAREKSGADLSEEEASSLEEFSNFRTTGLSALNNYVRSITGAVINDHEVARIMGATPNVGQGIFDGDSPTVFKSKLQTVHRQLKLAHARKMYTLNKGLKFDDLEIDRMESIIARRAEELRANGFDDGKLREALKQEFGL